MARQLHAHPTDRAHAHEAAERFGKLLAQGLLSYEEIMAALVGHSPGEQARLSWTVLDNAMIWERRRDRAEREIVFAIRDQIENMEDAAPILATAAEVNKQHGAPLLTHEVTGIVATRMAFKLAALKRKRSRG